MRKKCSYIFMTFLWLFLLFGVTGCGAEEVEKEMPEKVIGITMNRTKQWESDGDIIKTQLENLGYQVDLEYADSDAVQQANHIRQYIDQGVSCIVVAAVDELALTDILEEAKSHGIPIIAYEVLIKNTKAVNYYLAFDDKGAGILMGQKMEAAFWLSTALAEGRTYTMELVMGDPESKNDEVFYDGIMQVMEPYIDEKTVVCRSGKTEYKECATPDLNTETAGNRLADIINTQYAYVGLDMIFANGETLEEMAQELSPDSFVAGGFIKDHELLADKAVKMIQNVADGYEPEVNDLENYYNGQYIVPAYVCREGIQ